MTPFLMRVDLALAEGDLEKVKEIKKEILEALELSDGKMYDAAKILDVDYSTLNKATKRLDMKDVIAETFPGKGKPRLIVIDGVAKTATEWAREKGVNRTTILSRESRGTAKNAILDPEDHRSR